MWDQQKGSADMLLEMVTGLRAIKKNRRQLLKRVIALSIRQSSVQ